MDKLEEFLVCRRKNLQLAHSQHKYKFNSEDLSVKGKLREIYRILRKYREQGLNEMIEKEKWSYKMALETKRRKILNSQNTGKVKA